MGGWQRVFDGGEHAWPDKVPLARARDAAGDRDVRIAGAGLRLFDGIDAERIGLEIAGAIDSPMVTHLSYRARRR